MKAKEFQNKNHNELVKILEEKQNRLLELKFGAASAKVKDSSESKKTRKDIARILTMLNKK